MGLMGGFVLLGLEGWVLGVALRGGCNGLRGVRMELSSVSLSVLIASGVNLIASRLSSVHSWSNK